MTEAELQTTDEGTDEIGADLATADEEKHEGFVTEVTAQKGINKQHKKFRDEERAHTKTKTEADDLRKELDGLKSQSADVQIPPVPDKYDDDFDEQIKVRDKAIQRKAGFDAQQENVQAEADKKETERLDQAKVSEAEQIAVFDTNMIKLGLKPTETNTAAKTVIEYGVSDNLLDVLMEDIEGPLIVHYLANNPIEQDALNGMSALQLVNHINSAIRPKAALLKPKTSEAPDPPITLDGGGVKELQEPWEKGVVYE